HARALNAQAGSTRDTWRQAMRHGRSKVVLRCQNKFCFGVALGEVSLDHAFHISAWLAIISSNTNTRRHINWNELSILGSAARHSVGQVNVTRKSRALQQHPNAVRINRLILWRNVHVSGNARGKNLALLKLSTHGALQKLENRCSLRMLLANVCTDRVQRPGGHNHSAERMKC